MENPDFFDNEVVADSEEEIDPNVTMDRNLGVLGHGINRTSSVSAFTTAGFPQVKTFSAISEFTGDTPARPAYGNNLPEDVSGEFHHRRPCQADTSTSSITNTFTDFEGMSIPGNIADRAKMRQRTQKKPLADTSDVIELTSDDDDELGLKPSTSKTRPTPKPKTKSKAKQKAKEISSENAGTSNVSTKSLVPPKPRPRPVPIRKRAKTPQDAALAASTPGPELPIATSPPRMPQPNQRPRSQPDSQLPPSDPPTSTFRTEYNKENETVFPRIETLSKFGPGDPLSSPSSLFSDAGPTTEKRSGRSADSDAEIDELAPSDEGPVGYYQSERSILLRQMPPPPTFFAGSSSLSMEGDGSGGNVLPAGPDPQLDVVDLTDLPPTMIPTSTKSKTSSKPKKSKKKQSSNHDEYDDISAPMIILDEDEQDDDFDPSGDGEKKKKGKAKEKKGKGKSKTKESKAHPEGAKVEVFIATKPPKAKTKKKEKSDGKRKGNDKDSVKSGDKDTFKSREFIEDSDEDDPLRLVDGSSVARHSHTSSNSGPAVHEKASSSAKLTITIPVVQSPSALPKTIQPSSPLSDLDMPKSKSSKSKNSSGSKKRKSVVDSDHEGEAEQMQMQKNDTPSTSKKRKTDDSGKKKEKFTSGHKGKAKQIVLSDEEEESFDMDTGESAMQDQDKDVEKKKSSKMIVDDQSDQEHLKVDQQERSSIPKDADKSTKENAAPPLSKAPVVATPKTSKPIPLNNDGTTPLYARYEIAPRRSSLPMSELIRRANSMPGSPFSTPHPSSASGSASAKSKLKPLFARTPSSTAYSPYLKSSRSLLSKIAPLHPNRRTPPPPPPPPPPRKKSKKELELEAKWEEEMVEEAGGMEAWAALQDEERKEMRKMKWARELGGWDD